MSRSKAILVGLLAGLVAGIAMTVTMLVLAQLRIATPLTIIGDRISVFFKPEPFLALMGRVGGYNHLKQLGVGSTMAGQLALGAIAGGVFGLIMRRDPARRATIWTTLIFVLLPIVAVAIALWPVLGTSYRGLPIDAARLVTLVGFALSVLVFERTLVGAFHFLTRPRADPEGAEFSPPIARRALLIGAFGLVLAGGGVALIRKLFRVRTVSCDGTQSKGRIVQPITPNDAFYSMRSIGIDPLL